MAETNYPKSFLRRMKTMLGGEYEAFIKSLDDDVPVSLRINPLKHTSAFEDNEKISWCQQGRFLNNRPDFIFDPLIHAGAYYVQEASSMFFPHAIDFSKDLKILDLCAAPGGKTTLLLSLMSDKSMLVSNEIVGKRASILYENICKWGDSKVIISNNRPDDFTDFRSYFDVVLVDAPCSGEGMFRKNTKVIKEWSENKAFVCSVNQKNILDQAVHLVKNDGLLIYSTCTFSPEENEQILQWLYRKYTSFLEPATINMKKEWGVKNEIIEHHNKVNQEVYKCYPHLVKGEGMFISAFRIRNSFSSSDVAGKKITEKLKTLNPQLKNQIAYFTGDLEDISVFLHEDQVYAINTAYLPLAAYCLSKLRTLKCGVLLGTINKKNGEFIPSHELALSNIIRKDLPSIELDRDNALRFLKKTDVLGVELSELPMGWVLARYQGFNLGWFKNNGQRLNIFYPKQWTIRKSL